ncbi:hypothetical protein L6164_036060 [Bauhinia variegata]|uniref:Uncharacterized protein n=1 Tax=Bauhinia variegata TaxID=167791 RepID=A0ACB9KFW5_BAUVA|nr:hypothetical protein L6164_036060 [Bauhinia variegata]
MASLFLSLVLLLLQYPGTIFSQDPMASSSSPNLTMAQCTFPLLSLLPCAPFVQGTSESPDQTCCDNLGQLYTQEPHCLCLLLSDNNTSPFPINRTILALRLPSLCRLQLNISACSGNVESLPPTSPASQVSFGTTRNPNTTVAAPPIVSVAPRPSSIMGFGFGRSQASHLKARGAPAMLMTMAILLVTLFLC